MSIKVHSLLAVALLSGGIAQASAATLSFDAVQFPGTGIPLSVTGSDGTAFTFSAGPASQFQSVTSGGIGSFPAGATFLTAGLGNNAPIEVSFSTALSSISIPVSSDRVGDSPFTMTVQFFNNASLVGSITREGNTLNPPLIFTLNSLVTSAIISTMVAAADAPFGYTQNIGLFTYMSATTAPGAVPLPGALMLMGTVLAGGAGFARYRKRQQAVAA